MSTMITELDILKAVTAIAASALRREGHPTQGEMTISAAVREAAQALRDEELWPAEEESG